MAALGSPSVKAGRRPEAAARRFGWPWRSVGGAAAAHEEQHQSEDRQREDDRMDDDSAGDGDDQQDDREDQQHVFPTSWSMIARQYPPRHIASHAHPSSRCLRPMALRTAKPSQSLLK